VPYTTAGNYGVGWVAVGLASRRPARVAATVWGTLAVNYGIKQLVRRERPVIEDAVPLITLPRSSSFPSSHAAMSIAAAVVLTQLRPSAAPAWWTAAALMCASRVYVRAHHASDVVAGAVVGATCGAAALGLASAAG
jgi:membrane-associated phospholipid phosphatase